MSTPEKAMFDEKLMIEGSGIKDGGKNT